MKTNRFLFTAGIVLAMAFTFSCSSDDGGCNVEDGELNGCSYTRDISYTKNETSNQGTWTHNITGSTLKFTSDSKARLEEKVGSSRFCTSSGKTCANQTFEETITTDYTYVYAPTIREGYTETENGSKTLFSISADFQTLSRGGNSYKKN